MILLFKRRVLLGARYNHGRRGESRAHSRAGAPCPLDRQLCGRQMRTESNRGFTSITCVLKCQRPPHELSRPSPLHQNQCASGCLIVKMLPYKRWLRLTTTGALMLCAGTLLGGEVQTRSMQPPSFTEKALRRLPSSQLDRMRSKREERQGLRRYIRSD